MHQRFSGESVATIPSSAEGVSHLAPLAPAAARVRLIVVSDVRFVRDALTAFLGACECVEALETVESCARALPYLARHPEAIALVDLSRQDGLITVRAIAQEAPGVRIVAFAVGGEHRILACAEAGASGYVPHDASLDELLSVVQAVAHGELLCSPRMAASLFRRLAALASAGTGRDHQVVATLTDREREITLLLERQLSNKEIARALHIEVATVKNHVHNILHKLGVTTRSEAAARLRGAPAIFHPEARPVRGEPPDVRW